MVPVVHCSGGYSSLVPWTTFLPRKDIPLKKHNVTGRYMGLASSCERLLLPQLSSGLFHIYRSACGLKYGSMSRILAAVGTDVTVEEQNPAVPEDDANGTSDSPNSLETNETAPPTATPRSKRPRAVRKSEMPLLKDEEIVPGASFTGKVRSIQPFGAFVDIGAFTDGLVHVSRLSDGYVKEVGDLVSVGQEVKVRIVEVNKVSGRISLTMRDNDDSSKTQQRNEDISSGSSDKPRPARRNNARPNKKREEVQKSSKFVKGQVLDGTVKNLTRSGAFVALPDGEEGFLPTAEESEGFGNIMGSSSLQAGQEVNVRVLRITRGRVTLTMKKEEDVEGLNKQLSQGVVHVATNPFELAFRRNKDISSFLEEREKAHKASENLSSLTVSPQIGEEADETITKSDILEVDGLTLSSDVKQINVSSASGSVLEAEKVTSEELHQEASSVDSISTELVSREEEPANLSGQNAIASLETSAEDEESSKSLDTSSSISVIDEVIVSDDVKISGAMLETVERRLEESSPAANGSSENLVKDEASLAYETKEASESTIAVKENEEIPILEESVSKVSITDAARENEEVPISEDSVSDASIKENEVQILEDSVSEEISTIDAIEEDDVNSVTVEETNSDTQFPEVTVDQVLSSEATVPEEVASDQLEVIANETPPVGADEIFSSDSLNIQVNAPEISSVQMQTGVPDEGSTTEVAISPALVKQLREETGSGMMDCKKALAETGGDIIKAQEFLRKKGLASADKKSNRATAEGRIGSYIHDNRIGVLVEVNCETDFVSRGEIFKELVDDLAMQVAACPQVRYLATEDVPEDTVNKEREIEMQKEDLLKKPEEIRSKIVDGRIRKRLEEFALLEQPYIKNDKVVVKDFVKQTIATIGENIKVKRFIRYNLGEGLEKKSQDFAAEVAAQTAAKSSPTMPKDQPSEAKETVEKSPTIQVSAVLVKQLREETGAGMMDCKKALTETGGDLEKAQEYLRKKGLSSADKKSSRLAAEGRISSYIHDSRIGVLIEVNSETDFVARNEKFKELVDDLAMQVVACPQVEFVSVDEIPESTVNKEKEIEMQRDDLKSKPEHIREKIVDGRISKRLGELALLEQPFIKDDSILVKDFVKQTVAALGENIKVRRFVRFALGEN